jgi:hypothetical protein
MDHVVFVLIFAHFRVSIEREHKYACVVVQRKKAVWLTEAERRQG